MSTEPRMMSMVALIADSIASAELGYSLRLTRLVDGEHTYTLTYSDGETLTFDDMDDGYAHIRSRKREVQARAIVEALRNLTPAMSAAMNSTITAGGLSAQVWKAALDAALSEEAR